MYDAAMTDPHTPKLDAPQKGPARSVAFWAILLIALVARAGVGWTNARDLPGWLYDVEVKRAGYLPPQWLADSGYPPDAQEYWMLGDALAHRGEFLLDSGDVERLGTNPGWKLRVVPEPQPEVFRTPGYPALIAAAKGIFGPARMVSPFPAILALQVLLGAGTAIWVYAIARKLASHRVGLLAMAAQAITPVSVAHVGWILSEVSYTFIFTAAVWLLVGHLRKGGWWRLILAGLVMGGACYFRPTGVAISLVVAAMLLIVGGKRRWRRGLSFATVVGACLAPWFVRNGVRADYWGFSSAYTDTLLMHVAPLVLAEHPPSDEETTGLLLVPPDKGQPMRDGNFEEELDTCIARLRLMSRYEAEFARSGSSDTAGQRVRLRRQVAWWAIREHPGTFAQLHARGSLNFWLPGATDLLEVVGVTQGQKGTLWVVRERGLWEGVKYYFGGDLEAMGWAAGLVLIFLTKFTGVLLAVGMAVRRRRMSRVAWVLGAVVVASWWMGGAVTTPRFRVPVEPILSVAAAWGWAMLCSRRFRRRMDAADAEDVAEPVPEANGEGDDSAAASAVNRP